MFEWHEDSGIHVCEYNGMTAHIDYQEAIGRYVLSVAGNHFNCVNVEAGKSIAEGILGAPVEEPKPKKAAKKPKPDAEEQLELPVDDATE